MLPEYLPKNERPKRKRPPILLEVCYLKSLGDGSYLSGRLKKKTIFAIQEILGGRPFRLVVNQEPKGDDARLYVEIENR